MAAIKKKRKAFVDQEYCVACGSEITIEKNTGKVIILPVPVLPETLRNAVKTYLLIKEGK